MGITIGEQQMWHHIGSMAQSLNRIANCMEAEEKRKRQMESWNEQMNGNCSHKDCLRPIITVINEDGYCQVHLDEAFTTLKKLRESAYAALVDMEKAVKEGKG